jgi:peroxiredoxin
MRTLLVLFFISLLIGAACQSSERSNALDRSPDRSTEQPSATPGAQTASAPVTKAVTPLPNTANLPEIKVGQVVPEINATDVNGKAITVASRQDKNGELIAVYAPGCDICHATMPRWIELYRGFFAARNIPVIALSVQNQVDTKLSIIDLNIPFNVVVMPDVDLRFGHYVSHVPTTLAVGADGSIKGVWSGILDSQQLSEIVQIFCPECKVNVDVKKS